VTSSWFFLSTRKIYFSLKGATLRTHPWTHYLPTGLDNLSAATAHTNTRL